MKSRSRASAPTTVKRTVRAGRLPNGEYRTREYLTEREVERLMKAAGNNRHGHRDATMIHCEERPRAGALPPAPGLTINVQGARQWLIEVQS